MTSQVATICLTLTTLTLALPGSALAQPFGVFPVGGSDAQVAELHGPVKTVDTRVWEIDFAQRTLVKKEFISHTTDEFTPNGMISTHMVFDTNDELDSKTIFQYDDGSSKRVSTTYSKTGERTLQTLYAYTADGYIARMRFTDADAVTISTTEVSITPESTTTEEVYNDSEKVRTTYFYDKNLNLFRITKDNGYNQSEKRYALAYNGLPARGSYTTVWDKKTLTFEFQTDEKGNWVRRVTFVDGFATELAERTITYSE